MPTLKDLESFKASWAVHSAPEATTYLFCPQLKCNHMAGGTDPKIQSPKWIPWFAESRHRTQKTFPLKIHILMYFFSLKKTRQSYLETRNIYINVYPVSNAVLYLSVGCPEVLLPWEPLKFGPGDVLWERGWMDLVWGEVATTFQLLRGSTPVMCILSPRQKLFCSDVLTSFYP